MVKVPKQVFISAASSDDDVARKLSDRLERAGFKTWLSTTGLVPGDNWSIEVGEALRKSDVLVVLISPAAMHTKSIRQEITYALGEERFENRVIPILVKRTPRSEVPWPLHSLTWLEGEPDDVADTLVKSLKAPARAEAR